MALLTMMPFKLRITWYADFECDAHERKRLILLVVVLF